MNKLEYIQNNNVAFGLRKYNNINYIFVNNLEREKGIFKIKGNENTFYLGPIDVIIIKYSESSSSNYLLVTFIIIIIINIIVVALIFIVKRYLNKKSINKTCLDSVYKLTSD